MKGSTDGCCAISWSYCHDAVHALGANIFAYTSVRGRLLLRSRE